MRGLITIGAGNRGFLALGRRRFFGNQRPTGALQDRAGGIPGGVYVAAARTFRATHAPRYTEETTLNRWGIPAWLEALVTDRDRHCVYCGADFSVSPSRRGDRPSWEHIINDARIITPENIARCCMSCNASKGAKELRDWLGSKYCQRNGIGPAIVSDVVRVALERASPCSR